MAAGLGFKDFVTGEVLTAADVDGYLMQGVWVFASAAARDAAVTSPQEGNFAYLKDTNVTTYYTGSAWANLDTTGMTNPMTTTGDTIYSSSGSTPARLGIGTTGQVLTVAAGIPSWATPAGGGSGLTLVDEYAFTNSSTVNIDSVFTSTYKNYKVMVVAKNHAINDPIDFTIRLRASGTAATANYQSQAMKLTGTTFSNSANSYSNDEWYGGSIMAANKGNGGFTMELYSPQLASYSAFNSTSALVVGASDPYIFISTGVLQDTTQYDGIGFIFGNASTGTIFIYGYAKE